jgi:hypothetical protein
MMINRLSIVLSCGVFAMLAGACGGGGGASSAGDAIHSSYEKICAKAFECKDSFPGTADQFTQSFGADEAACVTNEENDANDAGRGPDDYQAAVDAGNITYNSSDADVCLASFDDLTCDQLWNGTGTTPPECDTAFEGQVADGGDCLIPDTSDECSADGSFCDSTTMTCTPG